MDLDLQVVSVAATFCEVWEGVTSLIAEVDVLAGFAELATSAPVAYVQPDMLPLDAGEIKLIGCRCRPRTPHARFYGTPVLVIYASDTTTCDRHAVSSSSSHSMRKMWRKAAKASDCVHEHIAVMVTLRERRVVWTRAHDNRYCLQAPLCRGAGRSGLHQERLRHGARQVLVPGHHGAQHGRQVHLHPPGVCMHNF